MRSNPRVLVPVALAGALVVGAALVAALVQIVVGLVALVLVGFFGYRLVRFVSKQLASYVAADADGVTICEYGEETHRHPWEQVTFAGHVQAADGSELLYVYVESADRLLTISPEFETSSRCAASCGATSRPPTWNWPPANPSLITSAAACPPRTPTTPTPPADVERWGVLFSRRLQWPEVRAQ